MKAPLEGDEPVLEQLPDDLRRELISVVGRYLAGVLEPEGASEEEILADFDAFRRRHR